MIAHNTAMDSGSTKAGVALCLLCLFSFVPNTNGNGSTVTLSPKIVIGNGRSHVHFLCRAQGTNKPTFTWYKDGAPISDHRTVAFQLADNVSFLRIRTSPVRRVDKLVQIYECRADDGVNTFTDNATLTLYPIRGKKPAGFPFIFSHPRAQVKNAGETVVFTCNATGSPLPTISWVMDNRPIDPAVNPRFSTPSRGVLSIANLVHPDDNNKYIECIASNDQGMMTYSRKAHLQVKLVPVKPFFTTIPKDQTVDPDSDVTLTCIAAGYPVPLTHWRRSNSPTQYYGDRDGKLVVSNVKKSTNFTCYATNTMGVSATSAYVTVRGFPLTPMRPTSLAKTADSITISWRQPGGGSPVRTFTLTYRRKGQQSWAKLTGISGKNSWDVTGLQPYTLYEFAVFAVNDEGTSKRSEVAEIRTDAKPPTSPPRDIVAYGTADDSFYAGWKEPLEANGLIEGYYLYFCRDRNLPLDKWWKRAYASNSTTIVGLPAHRTSYYIKILALNAKGPGPLSKVYVVKTIKGVPGQPRGIRVEVLTSTSMRVTWSRPLYKGRGIFAYEVFYNKTSPAMDSNEEARNTLTKVIHGLQPYKHYGVAVAAKSDRGVGPMSFAVAVRTFEHAPSGAPTDVKNTKKEPTSLEITWKPPAVEHQNGIITNYTLKYREKGQRALFITVGGSKLSVVLHNLKKFTDYMVWVLASTVEGPGPYSERQTFKTAEGLLKESPRNVQATPLNSTSVTVTWSPPAASAGVGVIVSYVVRYQENIPRSRFQVAHVNSDKILSLALVQLKPETTYKVGVAAYTAKGEGPLSPMVICQTLPEPPVKPFIAANNVPGRPTEVHVVWATSESGVEAFRVRSGKALAQLRGRQRANMQMDVKVYPKDATQADFTGLGHGLWYLFAVSVRNKGGWSEESFKWVQISFGPPTGPPLNVSAAPASSSSLRVTWNKPDKWLRNGPLSGYSVEYNPVGDKSRKFVKNITNPNETRVELTRLQFYAEYEIRVRAFGTHGTGPYSDITTERTGEDVPSQPLDITAEALSTTSIKVSWKPPARANGAISGYKVLYTDDASLPSRQWRNGRTRERSIVIDSLSRGTTYWINVAARTSAGLGQYPVQPISEKTLPFDFPGVPRNGKAEEIGGDTVALKWTHPEEKAGITHYKISYEGTKTYVNKNILETKTLGDEVQEPADLSQSFQELRLQSLMPKAKYTVRIAAVNSKGAGLPLKWSFETEVGRPPEMKVPQRYEDSSDFISLAFESASTVNGPISFYLVCVVPLGLSSELPKGKVPDDYLKKVRRRRDSNAEKPDVPYIAAKFSASELPSTFHVGDESYTNSYGYSNKELRRRQYYTVFLRAYVDNGKEQLYRSSPFIEPVKISGSGDASGQADPREAAGGVSMTLIIAAVVAFVVVLIVIVVVVVLWRRKRTGEYPRKADDKTEPSDPVEMKRMAIQTPAMMDHPPIHVSVLPMRVSQLKSHQNAKLTQEYSSIEPAQGNTTHASTAEANKMKNRYPNILAHDHSRVRLSEIPGDEGSDYINANYCDGYRKENAYIATQGPLDATMDDFWRMVWEQGTFTIVMLTKLEERGRTKCAQYWPEEGTEIYGDIEVALIDWVDLAHYSIMTLQICKEGSSQPREVKHFQFTGWPDHGVPPHPTPFLTYLRRVRFFNPPDAGPIVVHCSAGVGRTACFIVIDSMLERIKHESTVDVYGHVTVLRTQRNYMVQQEEQYLFIHDALVEAVACGHTEVHARNLLPYINKLDELKEGEVTGLEEEFKRLSSPRHMRAQKQGVGSATINKSKNRHANILPYESSRVQLAPLHGSGSDYINANFIDGYGQRGAFIATQAPLKETTDDFWRMIMEQNCSIIVMLTQLDENDKEMCYEYWPTDHSARHEHYIVDPVTEQEFATFIIREFKVKDVQKDTVRNVKQFQFYGWPEHSVPKTGEGVIDLIGQVQRVYEQQEEEGPITVHCSDGVGRTGVFCALSNVLDRMRSEGVVDIFQTVKLLRTQRANMVQTQEQYMFCYKTALEFLGSFDHYAI